MRRRKQTRLEQYESKTFRGLQERLAATVARLRARRGWTQADAAHHCEMTIWQYQRVESGITNVTFTTLARVLDGFEIDVKEAFAVVKATSKRS